MEMNNKRDHLPHIIIFCIMLLFVMCLTMNTFFYNNYNLYNLYGSFDEIIAVEARTVSESIAADGDRDHTICFKSLFLNENNPHTETITKNTHPIPMTAAVSKGFSLFLFLVIVSLFGLFMLLSDRWTLIDQKVRLNN